MCNVAKKENGPLFSNTPNAVRPSLRFIFLCEFLLPAEVLAGVGSGAPAFSHVTVGAVLYRCHFLIGLKYFIRSTH